MLTIIVALTLLVLGLFLLIKGADVLVEGASVIAKKLGVSELVIGLTVVSFGTSLPELIVSLLASSRDVEGLAIGNIIGSNIANILLILGISAIITPLTIKRVTVWREILFSMAAGGVLALLVADEFIGASDYHGLDKIDGIVLMTFFALFLYYSFGRTRIDQHQAEAEIDKDGKAALANTFFKTILGIIMLGFGGQLIVDNASALASTFGVEDGIIGLSIVALGTSAPELAASIAAVRSNKIDIAVGNVVGSNLFNTFWVLGISAFISPLAFSTETYVDVTIAGICGVLLFMFMAFAKPRHTLSRANGYIFVSLYGVYMVSLIARGAV